MTCGAASEVTEKQVEGKLKLNRNILYAVIGGLAVATSVLGYQFYQHQRNTTGIEIDVGKDGISIQKN
jgi:hypothetical protein